MLPRQWTKYRYAKTDCLFPVQLLGSMGNTKTRHEQKEPTASQYIVNRIKGLASENLQNPMIHASTIPKPYCSF